MLCNDKYCIKRSSKKFYWTCKWQALSDLLAVISIFASSSWTFPQFAPFWQIRPTNGRVWRSIWHARGNIWQLQPCKHSIYRPRISLAAGYCIHQNALSALPAKRHSVFVRNLHSTPSNERVAKRFKSDVQVLLSLSLSLPGITDTWRSHSIEHVRRGCEAASCQFGFGKAWGPSRVRGFSWPRQGAWWDKEY